MQLDKHEAKIAHVSIRREKHGKEGKLGIDITLAIQTQNVTLDMLQKGLKEALFRKAAKGEQLDAFEGSEGLVALKFPMLEPIKIDLEYTGYEVILQGNLDAPEGETSLIDVKLKDFTIKPIEGGSAQITFKAQLQADLEELSEVFDWWMVESVRLTLTPPKNQVEQLPTGGDGDTLDQQAANDEAARLIEAGKAA